VGFDKCNLNSFRRETVRRATQLLKKQYDDEGFTQPA
jgi:hypothetical protein